MVGMTVTIPYVRESIIFLSGYRGVDIWFVPFPTRNYGGHAEVFRVGRTSLATKVEVWVRDRTGGDAVKVTEGVFTFVALDETGKKCPVPPE